MCELHLVEFMAGGALLSARGCGPRVWPSTMSSRWNSSIAEHMEHQVALRSGGIYALLEHLEVDATFREVGRQADEML